MTENKTPVLLDKNEFIVKVDCDALSVFMNKSHAKLKLINPHDIESDNYDSNSYQLLKLLLSNFLSK